MRIRTLALGVALALAAVVPAQAQRGNWELLGEEKVGFGADRDVITLRHGEDFYRNRAFRKLRFVAEGGEIRMRSIRLHYLNGHVEDIQFEQNLNPGQEIDVDLKGERSYIRQIEMSYRGKLGLNLGGGGLQIAQPRIKVFAENVRLAPPSPPPAPPPHARDRGFDEVGRQRFDRRDEKVDFRIGRREGRFGQFRITNSGDGELDIIEVRIKFANGQVQSDRRNESLGRGQSTRPIDLTGDQRQVDLVTVLLNPRKRPGQAELTLYGSEHAGREHGGRPRDDDRPGGLPPPRGNWVPLGQQSVGFAADRDVIRINQSEDWFRNRGFDRLHFVAESNDVHMTSIRVVYLNGHGEDYRVDRLLRAGTDLAVDLPGRRSYIREIQMVYRARPGFGGRAVMSVYGEPSRR